ncbi:unnamed protein product [Dicrocoelium dendriticum]|nr:unnamed protein product [Dicrocoelium dendriticum]
MKIKELERFAHCAWSPASCDSTILATITAEDDGNGTLGTCTSSPPVLELFRIQWDSQLDMPLTASINVESRSTRLCWSQPSSGAEFGLLISGGISGDLVLYNPYALLTTSYDSEFDSLSHVIYASKTRAHTGVVRGLDANRFQTNLFASVSDESEIYIWDVEKFDQPMSPGNKLQPPELISTVAWNPHVQHILATTCAGHCTIWDLRRSDPVIHLTKTMCQFEPHLMAWSPDVATRLCLADPSHPTADVLLWDLRYPKHMLALIARWPPSTCGPLDQAALGNAGTVNALVWSPILPSGNYHKPGLSLHDPDLVAVSITASGALPTPEGGLGTGLEPTSGEFLVVWSVSDALKAVQSESVGITAPRQPLFVARLEDSGLDGSPSSAVPGALPTNAAVHWLPKLPGLVGVTQSDGWISVINLLSGIDKPSAVTSVRLAQRSRAAHSSRSRHASHKVAEAFGEEVDLSDISAKENTDSLTQLTEENVISDPTLISWEKSAVQQNNVEKLRSFLQIPQPLPCLRVAPCWTKRPTGANFSFGGRLVWFTTSSHDSSLRTRSSFSQSTASTGLVSAPSSPAIVGSVGKIVHLSWIDTAYDSCVPGLKASAGNMVDTRQALVTWLKEAISQPVSELDGLCTYLEDFFEPSSFECSSFRIFPWKLFRVRLRSADQLVSAVSDQLGFNRQSVQSHIEKTLMESSDSLQGQENPHSKAIANLNILKMALVTSDLASSIRLCLHSTFTALNCDLISPLSAISVLLAKLTGDHELCAEIQQSVLTALNQGSSKEPALHTLTLLLTGLILGDWASVLTDWPLTDWSTALAAIVNHTMSQNASLFRTLCGILISRCLNLSEHCELSSIDRYKAAWTCAILCCDLDAIIQSWYGMHSLVNAELQGDQLLPLALQLIVVSKCLDESTGLIPSVSKLFTTVAMWLGQIRSGHDEEDITLALQLLHRFTLNPESSFHSVESDELAHRLWCSLSDTERRRAVGQFKPMFSCPFEKSLAFCGRQCPCALRPTAVADFAYSPYATAQTPSSFIPQSPAPNLPSLSKVTPPTVPGYPTSPVHSATMGSVLNPSQRAPSFPVYTSALSHNAPVLPPTPAGNFDPAPVVTTPWCPPSLPSYPSPVLTGTHQTTSIPPYSTTAHAFAPPAVDPQVQRSNSFLSDGYLASATGAPKTDTPVPPHLAHVLPHGPAAIPTLLRPQSAAYTSKAWNDPPMLAPTYHHPVRPVVSQNNFYDPTQFSGAPTQPRAPSALPSVESYSRPALIRPYIPPNDMGSPQMNGIHPPLPEARNAFNATPLPPPQLPPSTNLPQQATLPPHSSTVYPSTCVSTSNIHHQASLAEERFGFGVNWLPPTSRSLYQSGNQTLNPSLEQWPAAQPLGTASPMLPTTPDSMHRFHEEPVHHLPAHAPSSESTLNQVPSEFAAIENELTRLVQLCRTVGGKSFAAKMDIVERRLSTLSTIFRRWSSEGPVLSDLVLGHLKDCVSAASQSNFAQAVEHANLLIQSASGFESIHGFAPGLKILMQSARQLFPSPHEADPPHSTDARYAVHSAT